MAADRATMKEHIAKIIEGVPNLEELSAKQVREQLEQKLGLEQGSLKSEKATISEIIDEVLAEKPESEAEASASEEEEEKKPAKGKKRPAEASPEDTGKQPKSTCRTKSGDEAPKNVKKIQESMKMTSAKFLRDGPTLKIDLCGNELEGPPRTFSSGNKGGEVPPLRARQRSRPRGAAPQPRRTLAHPGPPSRRTLAAQVVHERQGGDTGGQHDRLGAGRHEHHHPRLGGMEGEVRGEEQEADVWRWCSLQGRLGCVFRRILARLEMYFACL